MLKLSCSVGIGDVSWASVLAFPAVIPYRGLMSFPKGRCSSFICVHPSSGCSSREMMPQAWWCILISRHKVHKWILSQIFFSPFFFSTIGINELSSAALHHTVAAFHTHSPGFVVASALWPATNLGFLSHLHIVVGPKLNHSTAFSQNGQRTLGGRSIPGISCTSLAFRTEFSRIQATLFVYSWLL